MGLQLPRRARRTATYAVVATGLLLLGSCSSADRTQIERFAMPEGATDRAPAIFELWKWSWVAALLVGALVWGLIGYACFRYRRRNVDEVPVQTRYHLPIEILYTAAPLIMVLVLFYFTVETQNEVLAEVPDPDHEITVVGHQWSWTFNYVEEDAVDGQTVHFVGTTAHEPTLVLPLDETVKVNLRSPDVIHSFWVPAFLFKLDVVPGRVNSFSFTPTREGTFEGRCAELCGVYHSRMLFDVEVVSPEEYDAYLQRLEAQGNVGLNTGNTNADDVVGLEEEVQDDDTTGGEE